MTNEQQFKTVLKERAAGLADQGTTQMLDAAQRQDTTNPKDLVSATKVPLDLFPPVALAYGALALKDGARKYGRANWRSTKVRMTVYIGAMQRHLAALLDGEDCAQDSGLHHAAHVIAGAAILLDALEGGQLIDDRPPAGAVAAVLERFKEAR